MDTRLSFREPGKPFSILLLDVDRLKAINTKLSHHGANTILRRIFEILREVVAPSEAYRLGGDEAGAILPDRDLATARELAEKIRRTVHDEFARDVIDDEGHTPTVTLSVGCASKNLHADEFYARVDGHLAAKKDRLGERNAVHDISLE
jgi:diguanylate cyclase (GGDEF)-like protein